MISFQKQILQVPLIELPVRAILHRLGYPAQEKEPAGEVGRVWREMIALGQELLALQAILSISSIVVNDDQSVQFIDFGWNLQSAQVARLFSGCQMGALFVCTLGSTLETRSQHYMHQNLLTESVILDAVGSETADAVADWVHYESWKDFLPSDLYRVTPRFSPGYGDWPLEAQKKLLKWIQATDIGIELNDSCLMHPRKSVSGVFGIRQKELT